MRRALRVLFITLFASSAAYSQVPSNPKPEFDAASIVPAAPGTGHFPAPASSKGGPGTTDPAVFRCTNCNLAFVIAKAFELEPYQLPGQASLPPQTFDINARVPAGATREQFSAMLQNLLKERFGLASHREQRQLQGYELVIGKNGPNLKESAATPQPQENREAEAHKEGAGGNWHGAGGDAGHGLSRPGLINFGGEARYRGDHQTMADLARLISTQLSKPVDDHTGLQGFYDIVLNWSDDGAHAATHPAGGAGFGDHAGRGGAESNSDAASGPTLVGAVQSQLGLRLEAKKATGNILIVDHVEKMPTAN